MPVDWDSVGTVVFSPDAPEDATDKWDAVGKVVVPAPGTEVPESQMLVPPVLRQDPRVEQQFLNLWDESRPAAKELAKAQNLGQAQDFIVRHDWSQRLQDPDTAAFYVGWADDEQLEQIPETIRADIQKLRDDPAEKAKYALDYAIKNRDFAGETDAQQWEGVTTPIPFVGSAVDIWRATEVKSAADRIESGKWKPRDIDVVAGFIREAQASEERLKDSPFGERFKNILKEMPAFVGEFVATGGAFTAGRKLGRRAIVKALGKGTAAKMSARAAAGGVTGLAAQLAANPQLIGRGTAESAAQRAVGNIGVDEDQKQDASYLGNLPQGAFQAGLELASERLGGPIGRALGKVPGVGKFVKGYGDSALGQAAKKVGMHGPLEEMIEERVSDLGTGAAAALDPKRFDGDFGVFEGLRGGQAAEDAAYQLGAEAAAFSLLPGLSATAKAPAWFSDKARTARFNKG